jgi:membrane associated rhomboid family serine protease
MNSHVLTEQQVPSRPTTLWPLATFPLSAIVIWAVNTGGEAFRWLTLGGIASAMALALATSLEAGLIAMTLFEPLRGFLRRAQYLFLPYTQTDPIHLVTPVITILALAMLIQRRRLTIFRATPLAGLVSILGLIYFLEIFNPLQGGLSVGLSGALFMLVPVAWFYFGQAVKPAFVQRLFVVVVVLGLLTSLYGVYQLAFGFPSFEQYWIDNTEFYNSISVGHVKRALATYSSAEEWGRYIEVGALIAFGFAAGATSNLRRAGWLIGGAGLSVMLLLTGQRTAMFGLIFGCLVMLLLGARTWRRAIGRLLLVLAPALLIAVLAKAPTNDDMLSHGEDERMGAVLSHTARGTLNPTEEGSLQERLKNWTFLATELVPYRPLGIGLGGTSLGAWRFNTDLDLPPIDSYFISTVITCGLPTALLFMWILLRATLMSWRSYRRAASGSGEQRVWRIAATLMPVLILNSIFGNTFTLYSVAPIGWLLVGWISAQQARAVEPPYAEIT